MSEHIQQAYDILDRAYREYKPSHVVTLTSWGHDSQVSTDIANRWRKRHTTPLHHFRVATINTGLSCDGWVQWCERQARSRGYPYLMWHPDSELGFNWYAKNARAYGFPYSRAGHSMQYRMLKERTINRIRRTYSQHRKDRVLFVSGQYRAESEYRSNIDYHWRNGNTAWASPLADWTKDQIQQYRVDNDLPSNPFYERVGGSGDCNCNWGNFVTLQRLKQTDPKLAAKLEPLDAEVKALHGWGWDETPSKGLLAERAGQLTLPSIEPLTGADLCAACHSKSHENEVMDKRKERAA